MTRHDLILVVDDEYDVRAMLGEILREEGYEVWTAGNGREALMQIAAEGRPALIVTDLEMPVMNGADLCLALHRDLALSRIPVLLISGRADAADVAAALWVRRFFQKPVSLEGLLSSVASYVRAPEQHSAF